MSPTISSLRFSSRFLIFHSAACLMCLNKTVENVHHCCEQMSHCGTLTYNHLPRVLEPSHLLLCCTPSWIQPPPSFIIPKHWRCFKVHHQRNVGAGEVEDGRMEGWREWQRKSIPAWLGFFLWFEGKDGEKGRFRWLVKREMLSKSSVRLRSDTGSFFSLGGGFYGSKL